MEILLFQRTTETDAHVSESVAVAEFFLINKPPYYGALLVLALTEMSGRVSKSI